MNKYNVVFSRLYEVEAENEEQAKERAIEDFGLDMECGFVTADNDDFSIEITSMQIK